MDAYFFDVNNRYIGKRALKEGESMPLNATSIPSILEDGQEAHFTDGKWTVSNLPLPEPPEPCGPSIECRVEAAEAVIMEMLEMMMI